MSFKIVFTASTHPESQKSTQELIRGLSAHYEYSVRQSNVVAKIDDTSNSYYYQLIYEFVRK